MRKCPFCGRRLTDEQFEEYQRLKRAEGGKVRSERKKAAGAKNMAKAREAITPERRAEILAKARAAKAAKHQSKKEKQTMKFTTYSRIEGSVTVIDEFSTKDEAKKAVQSYYTKDRQNGDFQDGIYGFVADGEPMGIDGIIHAEKAE